MKLAYYLILIFFIFIEACLPHCPKDDFEPIVDTFLFGKKFNKERMKRGIPILTDQWVTKDGLRWYFKNKDSYNALNSDNCGRHVYKEIILLNGKLDRETDYYIGLRKGLFWIGTADIRCSYENLEISYNYIWEKEYGYAWTIRGDILDRSKFPNSMWKADSMLRSWGIARMNYMPKDSMPMYKKYEKYEFTWGYGSEDLNVNR